MVAMTMQSQLTCKRIIRDFVEEVFNLCQANNNEVLVDFQMRVNLRRKCTWYFLILLDSGLQIDNNNNANIILL